MEQCKKTKILYFSKGVPTEEDKKKVQELGALIRDASAWKPGDFIEMCDMVAGEVPPSYRHIKRADQPNSDGVSGAQLTPEAKAEDRKSGRSS